MITVHALLRYIQRIKRMDTRPAAERLRLQGREVNDTSLIDALRRQFGVDIAAIRHEMNTIGLRTAIALGASRYVRAGCVLIIEGGKVVTVKAQQNAQPMGAKRREERRQTHLRQRLLKTYELTE